MASSPPLGPRAPGADSPLTAGIAPASAASAPRPIPAGGTPLLAPLPGAPPETPMPSPSEPGALRAASGKKKSKQGGAAPHMQRSLGAPDPHGMSGYLLKKRKPPMRGWHRRWFRLEKGILYYKKSRKKKRFHSYISVRQAAFSVRPDGRRFDIDAEDEILHLKAKGNTELKRWIGALQRAKAVYGGSTSSLPLLRRSHILDGGDRSLLSDGSHKLRLGEAEDRLAVCMTNQSVLINLVQTLQDVILTAFPRASSHPIVDVAERLGPLATNMGSVSSTTSDGGSSTPQQSHHVGGSLRSRFKRNRNKDRKHKEKGGAEDDGGAAPPPDDAASAAESGSISARARSDSTGASIESDLAAAAIYGEATQLKSMANNMDAQLVACKEALQREHALVHDNVKALSDRLRWLEQTLRTIEHEKMLVEAENHDLKLKMMALSGFGTSDLLSPTAHSRRLSHARSLATDTSSDGAFFDAEEGISMAAGSSDEDYDDGDDDDDDDDFDFSSDDDDDDDDDFDDDDDDDDDGDDDEYDDFGDNAFDAFDAVMLEEGVAKAAGRERQSSHIPPRTRVDREHSSPAILSRVLRPPGRTTLPAPPQESAGLVSILRKNIGKDLSKVALPVTLNEPLSMLQHMAEDMEYTELLDYAASNCATSQERLAYVAAFAVSSYACSVKRSQRKPFNPLLCETFELVREDKGLKFVAEQVSHHPPVSVFHAESPHFVLMQEMRIRNKFWGKSMEIFPEGSCSLDLRLKESGTTERYVWNKVTTCIHNIVAGTPWVDHYGEMVVTNTSTGEVCKLTFKSAGWRSTSKCEVNGTIHADSRSSVALARVSGKWHDALFLEDGRSGSERRCLWQATPLPANCDDNYGFTAFAIELNDNSDISGIDVAPPTDSRRRPDQRCLESGDIDAAAKEKIRIEAKQRSRTLEPLWFRQVGSGKDAHWEFTGRYWDRDWSRCADIF